jgi:hypothetical protein
MSVVETPKAEGLFARAQNILMRPSAEWDVIEAEHATVPGLFFGYACILAAIPPAALILQHMLFLHWALTWTIGIAVVGYVAGLIGVFVLGFVIDALATSFGGQRSLIQGMKLAVYPYTALWVAGVLNILPVLGALAILAGLYGLYILYLGIPKLMKVTQDKVLGYFIVSIVVAIVINAVIGAIMVSVTAAATIGTAGALFMGAAGAPGVVHYGNTSVDLGKLQASAQAAADQLKAQQSGGPGKVVAVDPQKLKALLPDTVAGAPRTDISSTSAGAGGFAASNAEATYQNGDARITLKVTDLAAAGGFAAMAGAMNVQSDRETATGYDKVSTINGRLTTEKYDSQGKSGEYSVIVGNRFSIEADGSGVTMDALRAAVAAVGPDRLEALAHG